MSRKFLTPPRLPSGSTLPAAGSAGDLFFKSDELKIYVHDGTTWVIAQGSGGGGGVTVSATAPVDPAEGDYWFDSNTTKSYIYYDLFWVEVGTAGSGYIVSASAPSNPTEGDVWFSTTEGVIYLYYDGFWIDPTTGGATGVPAGGASGQILSKNSVNDYDTVWIDNYAAQLKYYVKAEVALTKGQAVYVSGANGTNMLVSKAGNGSEATASKTLGLIAQDLAVNGIGFVIADGLLAGLDTSTATAGDPVWLGTNGNLLFGLVNKPTAPDHMVYLGVVTRVHAVNGEIFVKVQNGFEINELHDVKLTSLANGQTLVYNSTSGLWENGLIESGSSTTVSETAPVDPTVGDTWFKSSTGQQFIYYDSYWVELGVGPQGPQGPAGPAGVVTNYIHPFFF